MRRIVAGFASSPDGYIAGPNNEYDWILIDPEIDFAAWNRRFDTFLYGRKTFALSFAPGSKVSRKFRHVVFSNTLREPPPGVTLMGGDIKAQVLQLKQEAGKDIAVFGGGHLLSSLLDLQLVDELHISVIPVLLGSGIPMVQPLANRMWLQLTGTKTYSNGTVVLSYECRK